MSTNPLVPVPVEEAAEPSPAASRTRPAPAEIAAWSLIAAALLFVLVQHLVAALIAGLALYLVLDLVGSAFARRLSGKTARPLALLAVFAITAVILTGIITLGV